VKNITSCHRRNERCKCCERSTHLTKKLNFDTKSRCAGCFEDIRNGIKICAGSDSVKCRSLENREKFDRTSLNILDFHHLYRSGKDSQVLCKSCHRRAKSCKCCFRPTHKISSLNIDTPSKCAGCCKILINGKKQCADDSKSVKCRSSEIAHTMGPTSGCRGGSNSKVSDDMLVFHHLTRGNNHFTCVSCLSIIKNCKCCIRSTISASYLNFEARTKCAGCLSYIENGEKVCSGQRQSIKCRKLESTIKKRKFGVSFSKDDTLPETSPHVRARRTLAKSKNSTVSVPGKNHVSTGLQIVSDWTEWTFNRLNSTFQNLNQKHRHQY